MYRIKRKKSYCLTLVHLESCLPLEKMSAKEKEKKEEEEKFDSGNFQFVLERERERKRKRKREKESSALKICTFAVLCL